MEEYIEICLLVRMATVVLSFFRDYYVDSCRPPRITLLLSTNTCSRSVQTGYQTEGRLTKAQNPPALLHSSSAAQ